MSVKNQGRIVRIIADGRLGVIYRRQSPVGMKFIVNLIDENHKPILNEQGKNKVVFKLSEELETIGFQD